MTIDPVGINNEYEALTEGALECGDRRIVCHNVLMKLLALQVRLG